MTGTSVLEREMYSEAEAARLLGVAQSTLHYWLEGGTARGKTYKPVVRLEPRGDRSVVTWAEFVEAGLLREYRQTLRVPMGELRTFMDRLRDEFGVPYPLADRRPWVTGKNRSLVYQAQLASDLGTDFYLVAMAGDQFLLTPPSQSFLERVTWKDDVAAGWRPHDDPKSEVRIDPDVRFGRPAVNGISTEVLWEQSEAGEDVDALAEMFGLSARDVRWALSYELSIRAA